MLKSLIRVFGSRCLWLFLFLCHISHMWLILKSHCEILSLCSGSWARYCYQRVCVAVCLSVCLSVRSHISKTMHPNFKHNITGSAVALHCCKAHSKSIGKMENSTPCKIVTPENFILKLSLRDYVENITHYTNFHVHRFSGGFSTNMRNITLLWLFSCPVLFFSHTRPARTARPIFAVYGSNDVVPPKDGPFGG